MSTYPSLALAVRRVVFFFLTNALVLSFWLGCSSKPQSSEPSSQPAQVSETKLDIAESVPAEYRLTLSPTFGRWTGDWDQLSKTHVLRLVVTYSKTGFFYDKGKARGAMAEAAEQLEQELNRKLKTKARKIKVAVIPLPPGQLLPALNEGVADVIASSVIVTPERAQIVDFTTPIFTGAKVIVVTHKSSAPLQTLEDLAGQEICVPKISVAYGALLELNKRLKQSGKQEVTIDEADPNLTEEDLLEMTNAGLIPATVSVRMRAELWSKALPNIVVHSGLILKDEGEIAWAIRKNSPQLKAVLDQFISTHKQGTVFGNMMVQKYFKNAKFITDSTSQKELQKFQSYVKYFQKYAAQYNFDYLMLAAQGYQESTLQQEKVSPRGAVGVMQVMPKYAAADPINIRDVRSAENNIHAGTKMLAQIANTYFNDPGLTPVNKTLLTFAAYNAGPNRIVRLRKEAAQQGLDPDKWFGNVELVVAEDVGQETVQYVSNIFKYYVAYKMAIEQQQKREAAKKKVAGAP